MTEKNWKNKMKENCEKVKNFLKKVWKKGEDFKILKWTGFVLVALSSIWAILEIISAFLILTDRYKFQEIIKHFYNFNLFDYLSELNFYLIFGGGVLMNFGIILLLFFLGLYWYKKEKHLFDKKKQRCMILVFVLGLLMFSYGFYQAMPKIMTPLNKIQKVQEQQEKIEKARKIKKWKENGWIKEREDFDKGFWERGNYNG